MTDRSSNLLQIGSTPQRYNSKIQAKKTENQSVWAEINRQQYAIAVEQQEQEKQRKLAQKAELNEALAAAINEKNALKKAAELQEKQIEQMRAMERQQEYEQLQEKAKIVKYEQQKKLEEIYEKELQRKKEETKIKAEKERQMYSQNVASTWDSLDKEKLERDRRKKEFIQSLETVEDEKRLRFRKEQERIQREKAEYNQWMEQERQYDERKNRNYKMFYEHVNEKQLEKMDMYNKNIKQAERSRDMEIDLMIHKGISSVQSKAEEEQKKARQKQDELRAQYRTGLEKQLIESEELKKKTELERIEQDRKLHLSNFSGFPFGSQNSYNYKYRPTALELNLRKPNALQLSKSQDYGYQKPSSIENILDQSPVNVGEIEPLSASPTLPRKQNDDNGKYGGHKFFIPERRNDSQSPTHQVPHLNFLASTANRNIF